MENIQATFSVFRCNLWRFDITIMLLSIWLAVEEIWFFLHMIFFRFLNGANGNRENYLCDFTLLSHSKVFFAIESCSKNATTHTKMQTHTDTQSRLERLHFNVPY